MAIGKRIRRKIAEARRRIRRGDIEGGEALWRRLPVEVLPFKSKEIQTLRETRLDPSKAFPIRFVGDVLHWVEDAAVLEFVAKEGIAEGLNWKSERREQVRRDWQNRHLEGPRPGLLEAGFCLRTGPTSKLDVVRRAPNEG